MMDYCQDTSTASDWTQLTDFASWEHTAQFPKWWAKDSGVFVRGELASTPFKPAGADSSTLPGEVLTVAVTDNQEQRALLLGMVRRLAAEELISTSTLEGAASFFAALPRSMRLPAIGAAGEGALAFEWPGVNELGILLTIDGDRLHYVLHAGTPQAVYRDYVPIAEHLPPELLETIQG